MSEQCRKLGILWQNVSGGQTPRGIPLVVSQGLALVAVTNVLTEMKEI